MKEIRKLHLYLDKTLRCELIHVFFFYQHLSVFFISECTATMPRPKRSYTRIEDSQTCIKRDCVKGQPGSTAFLCSSATVSNGPLKRNHSIKTKSNLSHKI